MCQALGVRIVFEIGARSQFFGVLVLEIFPYCWNNISSLGVCMISIGNIIIYFFNKSIKIVVIMTIYCKYVENFSYVFLKY